MKKLIIIALTIIAIMGNVTIAHATVAGITSENYADYEKPIADEYGYNKGECDTEYLPGEEYFYNEYVDHWNVDKVYDESLIPSDREIAEEWASACGEGFKVKKVVTISKGKSGIIKGTNIKIKYAKKVKKGKKVKAYTITQNNTIYAVVCMGMIQ